MIGLFHYMILSAVVFVIGLFGALTRRNAITVLMSVELMFNAANISFVAISYKFQGSSFLLGQVFPLFVIAIAASEVTVGLALVLALYRTRTISNVDEANELRG